MNCRYISLSKTCLRCHFCPEVMYFSFKFLVCHRVLFIFLFSFAVTCWEGPKVKDVWTRVLVLTMFFFHYKLNLQQKLHFFYRSQAADALRSESASGRSQRTGAYWMESKQNVFFLNWTHFDTFWVILTCFHDDFFHFFWAVLWVCSNVQGFIAFAFVSTCSFFYKKGSAESSQRVFNFSSNGTNLPLLISAWGAQCDLLGLSFGSSSSRLPIGKRRTVPTPVGGPSWVFGV